MAKVIRTKTEAGNRLNDVISELSSQKLRVGYFDTRYENGTPVAYVASIHEFGSPAQNIPLRPTLRPTARERTAEWIDILKRGAGAIIKGNVTANQVMEQLGGKAAGDVQKAIAKLQSPPLKQDTVAARLSRKSDKSTVGNLTKPLVDTGLMLASVTHKVGHDS